MKKRILYYPSIDIKDGIWLRNAILYWDEVSSIMPYQNDDYNISPEVSYLISTNNFIPARPDDIMFSSMYDDFTNEVRKRFDEYSPSQTKTVRKRNIHMSKVVPDYHKLHESKLSSHVMEMIEERSEIIRSKNNQWISVDAQLSDIYMSILAKYLAAISTADTSIGTDRMFKQNKIFRPERGFNTNTCQSFLDYKFNILPAPNMDVSIEDILLFKEQRSDELRKLHIEINELERRLQSAEDIVQLKRILSEFEYRLESNVSDLNRLMRENKWNINQTVMNGLISMSMPGIMSTAEMFGASFTSVQEVIGLASGTILSIGLSIKDIGNMRRETLNNNPFAYVYHGRNAKMF